MLPFDHFYERALERHGAATLGERLPAVASADALRERGDDRYLAAMAMHVFSAGFRWRVIQAKWEGFEEAFARFDPPTVAGFDAGVIGRLAADTRIVRNKPKIVATVENARFVAEIAGEHGSFGAWLADWPPTDTVGLWEAMRKRGSRLGGATGPWFLRHVGKDTFRLSQDVVAALCEAGVVDKAPTSKRALAATQEAFDTWARQSGRPLAEISTILAHSIGDIRTEAH